MERRKVFFFPFFFSGEIGGDGEGGRAGIKPEQLIPLGSVCRHVPRAPRVLRGAARRPAAADGSPSRPGAPGSAWQCPPNLPPHDEKASAEPEDMTLESTEMTQDQLLNYQLMFPIGQDKSIPWNAITAYENMKAKRISELKKWREQGPCQKELYRALYKLAKAQQRSEGEIYKFYLPNCNKNGFYHSKQCETSLDGESAGCWCVYPKTGKRIPGTPELKGDAECQHLWVHNTHN
uniref:Insulin like growth factor binding protein 1 n=1 Tax=Apteryx owenii TaxID=8824 RepID=A0A8B9P199_APTOW